MFSLKRGKQTVKWSVRRLSPHSYLTSSLMIFTSTLVFLMYGVLSLNRSIYSFNHSFYWFDSAPGNIPICSLEQIFLTETVWMETLWDLIKLCPFLYGRLHLSLGLIVILDLWMTSTGAHSLAIIQIVFNLRITPCIFPSGFKALQNVMGVDFPSLTKS